MQPLTQEQLDDLAIICQTYADLVIANPTDDQDRRRYLALELLESYHRQTFSVSYEPNDTLLVDLVKSDCPGFD
jgi:hypothetical protein